MRISIQSYIDVITNSSTSIYQIADDGSVSAVEKLIDTILKMGGSGMRCKDVFKVSLELYDDDKYIEYATEEMEQSTEEAWGEDYEKYQELAKRKEVLYNVDYRKRDYDAIHETEDELIDLALQCGVIQDKLTWAKEYNEEEAYNGGYPVETRIKIEPISYIPSAEQTQILQNINDLFNNYATFD